jgi:hypothetical protein
MVAIQRAIDRIQATSGYSMPKTKPKPILSVAFGPTVRSLVCLKAAKKSDGPIGSETVTEGGRVEP